MSDEFEVTPEAQAWFDKETAGLKAKNDQYKGLNTKLTGKLDAYEKDKKTMLDKFQDDEARRLFDKGDFDAAFNQRYQASIQKSTETILDLERQVTASDSMVDTMKIQSLAQNAALQAGVRPDAVSMMMLKVAERYRMNDGAVIGYSEDGSEMFNEKGESLNMGEYIGSLATTMNYMFTAQTGSGANGQSGNATGMKKGDMTREQKSDFVAKHGADKFLALPA
jgi:hypothetical protein